MTYRCCYTEKPDPRNRRYRRHATATHGLSVPLVTTSLSLPSLVRTITMGLDELNTRHDRPQACLALCAGSAYYGTQYSEEVRHLLRGSKRERSTCELFNNVVNDMQFFYRMDSWEYCEGVSRTVLVCVLIASLFYLAVVCSLKRDAWKKWEHFTLLKGQPRIMGKQSLLQW